MANERGLEDFGCQAIDSVIRAECVASAPEAHHRSEYQKKVKEHQTRHPGGRLPNELCGFSDYTKLISTRLDMAERAKMKCLSCGQYRGHDGISKTFADNARCSRTFWLILTNVNILPISFLFVYSVLNV